MAINLANNSSLANITALPSSISGGGMTLISEQTASSSATISFTSGIDSTYDSYVFKFINIHPETDGTHLQVGFRDGSTAYDATMTTTFFRAGHAEDDGETYLAYRTDSDLAQSTSAQRLGIFIGSDNDQCCSGELKLFNPSSSVFVKHYISTCQINEGGSQESMNNFVGGYGNTTSVVNGVRFQMSSGNIDAGDICLYGIA